MRALVVATGYREAAEPLVQQLPTPLFRIIDKPIIHHILEFLSKSKISKVDILLHHQAHQIEESIQDGKRWGLDCTFHLVQNAEFPFSTLHAISDSWPEGHVLFCQGDLLPMTVVEKKEPIFWMISEQRWTGWGVLPIAAVRQLPGNASDEFLYHFLKGICPCNHVQSFLSTQSLKEYQVSNAEMISGQHPLYMYPTTATEVQKGVWISRGAALHRGVKIVPPVFIGVNTEIFDNVSIGPYTVIEHDCIIDASSKIENSLISSYSYIGSGLTISESIVRQNLLINLSLDAVTRVKDDFLLSSIAPAPLWSYPFRWIERAVGFLLFLVISPLYFWMKLSHDLATQSVVSLPTGDQQEEWNTFPLNSLIPKKGRQPTAFQKKLQQIPFLLSIAKGDMHFVGLKARTPAEVAQLPEDWRRLYVRSKAGLITLSDLDYGAETVSDECYASEGYYATHMGVLFDIKIFFRWLYQKIIGGSHA